MVWSPIKKSTGVLLIAIGIVTYPTPIPISNTAIAGGLILYLGRDGFEDLKERFKLWRANRKLSRRGTRSHGSTVPIGARAGLQLRTS